MTDAARQEIDAVELKIREGDKAAREAQAKADEIDAAVFDLKAVNPNAVIKVDDRSPEQIISSIESQGRVVVNALTRLTALLAGKDHLGEGAQENVVCEPAPPVISLYSQP